MCVCRLSGCEPSEFSKVADEPAFLDLCLSRGVRGLSTPCRIRLEIVCRRICITVFPVDFDFLRKHQDVPFPLAC